MPSSGMKLASIKDLFKLNAETAQQDSQDTQTHEEISLESRIVELDIDNLVYMEQPFREYTGEQLMNMVESIEIHGVLVPILVRPYDNTHQVIAGRNRAKASKLAGKTTVPCIIKPMDDDSAILV